MRITYQSYKIASEKEFDASDEQHWFFFKIYLFDCNFVPAGNVMAILALRLIVPE